MSTVDTYIDRDNPDADLHLETSLFWVDETPTTSVERHALIRFDGIIGPGAIPIGASIRSAQLTLVVTDGCSPLIGTIAESRVEFGSRAAWNSFGSTPGVQPEDVRSGAGDAPVGPGPSQIDVTETLRSWSADFTLNNGWVISPAPMGADACEARSSDAAADSDRPTLTVELDGE
jgi:hypothetical protein